MKPIYFTYSLLLIGCMLIVGCYKDRSTVDTNLISEISIDLGIPMNDPIYDIEKLETLEIKPLVSQSNETLPLSYEWEVDHKIVSTDKDWSFHGDKLGEYLVRLKVSNSNGSAFKTLKIRVNSPYEEGLFVLSEGSQQEGSLAFIRKYPNKGIQETPISEVTKDVFAINNNGTHLGKKPSDIVKRGTQLYIASIADQSVTLVNHQTMEMQSTISAPEFPDFKPYRLNIPDNNATSSIVLTTEGKVFNLATKEHLVLSNTAFPPTTKLDVKTQFVDDINFTMNYFWDPANSKLWNLWYTNSNSKDELQGQDLVQFFAANKKTYILTKDKNNPTLWRKTVFGPYIQKFFADPLEILEKESFTIQNPTLNKGQLTVVDDKLFKLVYAQTRAIYQWYYSGKDIPTAPFITIDIPGEITAMERHSTRNELYVGVFDATATGNKGSILIYNLESGKKIAAFPNICDKPVKLLYKVKT